MRTFTQEQERRIASGVRLIKTWKKNIRFIEKRLEMQAKADQLGHTLSGRKFNRVEIEIFNIKIKKAKLTLENI